MVDGAPRVGGAAEWLQQAGALQLRIDRRAVEGCGEIGLDARLVDAPLVLEPVGARQRAVLSTGSVTGIAASANAVAASTARPRRGGRHATVAPPAAHAISTGIG